VGIQGALLAQRKNLRTTDVLDPDHALWWGAERVHADVHLDNFALAYMDKIRGRQGSLTQKFDGWKRSNQDALDELAGLQKRRKQAMERAKNAWGKAG